MALWSFLFEIIWRVGKYYFILYYIVLSFIGGPIEASDTQDGDDDDDDGADGEADKQASQSAGPCPSQETQGEKIIQKPKVDQVKNLVLLVLVFRKYV